MKIHNPKDKMLTLVLLAAVLGAYLLLRIPCPVQHFLHIPCPCCGMTRAWRLVLQGDFAAAFQMHGMFWSVPLLMVLYIFDCKIFPKKWLNDILLYSLALGFGINWILHF